MTDREKVIKGLECCAAGNSGRCIRECPYDFVNNANCVSDMTRDALELLKEQRETIASVQGTIRKLIAVLEEQPEQKHGHWVFDPDGRDWNIPAWKCSECHCRNDNIPPNLEKTNPLQWAGSKYCPNCGAKMNEEVKQDDRT